LLTDDTALAENGHRAFRRIRVPQAHAFISPLLYAIPVQLIAYHAAVFMGTDVDQPRNLAKSVTVE
ncbi:MAG: glutamine--fructose-6-phosphate aminotransferase, partial [Rhizobiales bacterium]|nr:glutamine--fructose-6-phosphate aminotransferase [Hyphomicrobiales bacterium]